MFDYVTDSKDLVVEKKLDRNLPFETARPQSIGVIEWTKLVLSVVAVTTFVFIYSDKCSLSFTLTSWLLSISAVLFFFCEKPGDTLSAAKIASILYSASFGLAPIWISHFATYSNPFFGYAVSSLMESASILTLTGYLCFLTGYYIIKVIFPAKNPTHNEMTAPNAPKNLPLLTFITGTAGLIAYVMVLMHSGGLSRLLSYSEGRADIFTGVYGGWFWGAHFLFVAYGLFAVQVTQRHPTYSFIGAVILAAMFFPFQGRDLVVAPLFCWLIFYHLLKAPMKLRYIVVGFMSIVLVSSILGAFRASATKSNANSFISTYSQGMEEHLTKVVTANIEQLDTVMASVRYIDLEKKPIGPMVLFSWLEPIDRAFLGDIIPSIHSGVFIDLLLVPEHFGWNTAASPSLPGEFFLGMGWFGLCIGLLAYGGIFGTFDRWVAPAKNNLMLLSAYPFTVFITTKMIVDGTAHTFRVIIVLIPVILFSYLTSNKSKTIYPQERP